MGINFSQGKKVMLNVIVAAAVETRTIGLDGGMPWGNSLKTDLKYFKVRTENNIVIMGRKTYESIGKALPNRINIVLSSDPGYTIRAKNNVWVCESFESALKIANTFKEKEIFVIGGGKLYDQVMNDYEPNRIYVTWVGYKVDGLIDGDTYFPKIDKEFYNLIDEYQLEEGHYQLTFTTYERNGNNKIKSLNHKNH